MKLTASTAINHVVQLAVSVLRMLFPLFCVVVNTTVEGSQTVFKRSAYLNFASESRPLRLHSLINS